ncbi:hypothetical protein [Burkholderia gladioli]|uniref:hypothetical protein n=1 Tax=Burkholderia gladioli TaxID=28095 RepID=UPI001641DA80|nr:hypothetical protein [Burkholderia gladioli]
MSNINQLAPDTTPQLSDQLAIWAQNQGQPRKVSLSALLSLLESSFTFSTGGLLLAGSLYSLRRTQAETIALTSTPAVIAPFDANGASVVNMGGTSLTQNILTGVMQATRPIKAVQFWVALVGSVPASNTITLALQTGPVGGPLYTSEFQSIAPTTGGSQALHFAGILQNQNNPNSQINTGDIIQLVASVSSAANLSLSRASVIVQPLDGV